MADGARPHGAKAAAEVERMARQLQLRARARADGGVDRPGPEASAPAAVELEILAACEAQRTAAHARAEAIGAQAALTLAQLAPKPQSLASLLDDAQLALRQAAQRAEPSLRESGRRAAQARQDLDAFRAANGLGRMARYPASPLLQIGLLVLAVVFEAAFSATLFAQEDARGLLGGAATAVGLAGANVALGFLGGFLGLRYLQHRNRVLKTAGGLCFAAFLAAGVGLNVYAAHWRQHTSDAAAAQARITETRAINRATEDCLLAAARLRDAGGESAEARRQRRRAECLFERNERLALANGEAGESLLTAAEPQAVVLLMLGLGVWVFAALKGYSGVEDPYPEYGKLDRAAAGAAADEADLRADLEDEIGDEMDRARAAVLAHAEAQGAAIAAMRRAFDAAGQEAHALALRAAEAEETASALVQLYRAENSAARRTPAPAYFASPPPQAPAPADPLRAAGALMAQVEARAREDQALGKAGLAALEADAQAVRARLSPPDAQA